MKIIDLNFECEKEELEKLEAEFESKRNALNKKYIVEVVIDDNTITPL